MYYRKTGNGPVVVLLHGFPDSGEIWDNIATDLSAHFTLIIPDLPGSGKSLLEKEYSLSEMAQGVKKILDAEGIGRAVVAGHSMGGYTALAFARLYPETVVGLSLIHSTATADDEEKKKIRQKAIELIRNGGKNAFITQMTANLFAVPFREANPQVVKDKVTMGLKMSEDGIVNFYRAMIGRDDNTETLKDAAYPVQWVMGKQDVIVNYKKNLKECHLSPINFVTLYTDCGHISIIEDPVTLLADLKMFSGYCYKYNPGS